MIKMWISILLGQDCTLGRGSPLSDDQYVCNHSINPVEPAICCCEESKLKMQAFREGRQMLPPATPTPVRLQGMNPKDSWNLHQKVVLPVGNWEVFINGWSRWKATSWHFLGTPCHAWLLKHGFCLPVLDSWEHLFFFPTSVFLSVSCEESEISPNSSSVNKMTVSVLGGMLLQLWCRKVEIILEKKQKKLSSFSRSSSIEGLP